MKLSVDGSNEMKQAHNPIGQKCIGTNISTKSQALVEFITASNRLEQNDLLTQVLIGYLMSLHCNDQQSENTF